MTTRMVCFALISLLSPRPAVSQESGGALTSDSRTPYVHRITLYDHDGAAIDPKSPLAPPYSPRMTCGKCHDYAAIRHGWHFNAGQAAADGSPLAEPGRRGEPWWWVDRETGTVLPLSGRRWPGTFAPEQAGISAWDFVKRFGRHLPGGGLGELSQREMDQTRESARWTISGALEIDCLICHSANMRHDPAEAAQQIADENFRWAPTAAFGLGVIRGQARRLPDEFDPLAPPSPDRPDQVLPKVVYDQSRFDGDDRVFFDVTRTPPAERCYFCHSQRWVGPEAPPPHVLAEDVHLAAGLTCTDCHVNGIDHMITRGADEAAALSCVDCHLGGPRGAADMLAETTSSGAAAGGPPLPGRLGAPYPQHAGIPNIHFEKLTCTACHSGPWPQENVRNVQTSLAHGLGLGSKERRADDRPHIIAPVFAPQSDGRISSHRMVWPAFFGVLKDGKLMPASPAEAKRAVAAARRKTASSAPAADSGRQADQRPATGALDRTLIAEALRALPRKPEDTPVYIADGRLHRLDDGGSLRVEPHPAAEPYLWSLAHDVRPAGQSLGVRGCTDCHAPDSPFFFGRLDGAWADGGTESRPAARTMADLQRLDGSLTRAWALPFRYRPIMTWIGWASVALVAMVLLAHAIDGVRSIGRRSTR